MIITTTITTTITTVVDPAATDAESLMHHDVVITSDNDEIPAYLRNAVAQAACEHTIEALMESGIGVLGDPWDNSRCPVGNMYRMHLNGPCEAACDLVEVVV